MEKVKIMPYDNNNTFALFDQKEKYEEKFADRDTSKWPRFSGRLTVDGKEFEIAAWVKEDRNGKKYFSGVVKEKQDFPQAGGGNSKSAHEVANDLDDDIPF